MARVPASRSRISAASLKYAIASPKTETSCARLYIIKALRPSLRAPRAPHRAPEPRLPHHLLQRSIPRGVAQHHPRAARSGPACAPPVLRTGPPGRGSRTISFNAPSPEGSPNTIPVQRAPAQPARPPCSAQGPRAAAPAPSPSTLHPPRGRPTPSPCSALRPSLRAPRAPHRAPGPRLPHHLLQRSIPRGVAQHHPRAARSGPACAPPVLRTGPPGRGSRTISFNAPSPEGSPNTMHFRPDSDSNVETEVHHVAFLHDVVFAFAANEAGAAQRLHRAQARIVFI